MIAFNKWYAGGLLGSLMLLLAAYLLLISPQKADTATVSSQVDSVGQQNTLAQQKITVLKKDNEKLNQYKADLADQQLALPASDGLTDFMRELDVVASATKVTVIATTVGATELTKSGSAVSATTNTGSTTGSSTPVATGSSTNQISITVSASGLGRQLRSFLDQLQTQQDRAVLVTSTGIAGAGTTEPSIDGPSSLEVSLKIFVSPSSTKTAGS